MPHQPRGASVGGNVIREKLDERVRDSPLSHDGMSRTNDEEVNWRRIRSHVRKRLPGRLLNRLDTSDAVLRKMRTRGLCNAHRGVIAQVREVL